MLSQFGQSTWFAIGIGVFLAILGFLPVVAVRYRKAGRLRLLDVLVLLAVAVYAVALWTYTLIPLPEADFHCARPNLRPFAFIDDIRAEGRPLLRNRALFQAVFNVVLFAPLGFFLRVLARKGVLVATGLGLATTLAIEFTQYTGIWGLYPCAYRVFDVDDLILNTSGAILGSLVAIPIAAILLRTRPAPAAATVTLGRRLVGMLADVMVVGFVGLATAIPYRAVALYLLKVPLDDLSPLVDQVLTFGLPLALEAWWVLRRGRTVGEEIVQLEPVAAAGRELPSRALKLVFGVGGWLMLSSGLVDLPLLGAAFVVATVVLAWRSRDHRGLSHLVAGMELRVERPSATDG